MIEVEGLTRRYGDFVAVDDVSFTVERGEVVGFLGPNGAGKSTTMRMLCGCIGATAGRARVGGVDVLDAPSDAKRRIGYLPEVPPLYPAMEVEAYVAFAAQLRGVARPDAAAAKAVERVGLGEVRHRIIDHLSKGYRQRVGLAQALVHEPEVLVLDEPTSGLDPAQRREIRELLLELAAGEATVILSTHVLAEVEAVCERVIVINRGRLVATDRIDALASSEAEQRLRLRVQRLNDELVAGIRDLSGVGAVEVESDAGLIRVEATRELRPELAQLAVSHGILELSRADSLEDIYLQLTSQGGS
jgi:ABC-2 type transport system ATP-binding protein